VGVALFALGCSIDAEQYSADADTGSKHALVGVERSVSLDHPEAARGAVVAGFVQMPADLDAKSLFELVGLSHSLPAAGQCRSRGELRSTPPLSSIGHVEFLEAGEVNVSTAAARSSLAPHAFPTVTELISGVVYTTRDRSSAPLPAGTRYAITASGSAGVEALSIERDAPADLEAVTIGGVALADTSELSIGRDLDFTWNSGDPNDLVLVELSTADGASASVCVFRDDVGAGTVPQGTFGVAGPGRVSLRRVREIAFSSPGLDMGELRFDFELASGVTFTE
jgi:hypothetical protein